MRRLFFIPLIAAVAAAAPVRAQQPEPERPGLPRGADPNDWEAYFDQGESQFERFPARAAAAFYWAGRLDPTRAEPLFAQWAVFFSRDWGLWLSYVYEEKQAFERTDVIANEALRRRSYYRNPFVHRGFEAALWSRMGREMRWDGAATAFMNYGRGDFAQAAAGFGRVVRANPVQNVRWRQWRALSFAGAGQLDSAAVELGYLLETLRTQDQVVMGYYESKAMHEFALGMLHEAGGRTAEARRAWERALEEDMSMYPARAALARLALRERHTTEAADHMAQAVDLAPNDAVMQFEYGNALVAANRRDDAIAAYQRAVQLEPYWAEPYMRLGIVFDNAGRPAEALFAYRAYLERAPRRHGPAIQRITERIAALGQSR
jgi:tetratricopeptide (TPR) repeat protein